MNSENASSKSPETENTNTESSAVEASDYEAEGLVIKEEGLQEGKIFPGADAEYPLRDPSEDPTWAVRIVKTWMGIVIFSIIFIVTLMILGIWYD